MNLTPDQWNKVGADCSERAQFEAAIHCFRRGLQINPRHHQMRTNLADNLRRNWEFDEALVEIQLAMKDGMFPHAQFVLACTYLDMGVPDKALRYFTPQICTTPYGRYCRAQALLAAGRYAEGWAELESRLDRFEKVYESPVPIWKGQPLAGKTVLVHHEEGYGDSLAYTRFINLMPKGSVILGMPSALVPLMQASFPDIPVTHMSGPLPKADYYSPLMSLPHHMGLKTPAVEDAYICPQGRFDIPRTEGTRLKVGLVWRSKAGHADSDASVTLHGRQKSMPLEALLPIGDIPGVQLYSLQVDNGDIAKIGADYLIYDLGAKCVGFHDLALFMQEMDVVVSVDTAPIHLAGAMGKECYALLSCRSGWPYPRMLDETDWYPTMTVLRQSVMGDWKPVVDELCLVLSEVMADAPPAPQSARAAAE